MSIEMVTNILLGYGVKHFGSFGGEGAYLDLTTSSRDPKHELWNKILDNNVNLITVIMGANGSGKTNLLKAMPFLRWFFLSIPAKIGDELYLPTNRFTKNPCTITANFIVDSQTYKYELVANNSLIISEELYSINNNRPSYIFKRKLTKESFKTFIRGCDYDENLDNNTIIDPSKLKNSLHSLRYDYKEKHSIFPLGKKEGERTPCNTSIISSARRLGIEVSNKISDYFAGFESNVSFAGRIQHDYSALGSTTAIYDENPNIFAKAKEILASWDLGLDDIRIEKETKKNEQGENEYYYDVTGIHKTIDDKIVELPFFFESAGTQGAYAKLCEILMTLESGGCAFLDELGDDLHPHMVKPILELFTNKETNPHSAQLIFSCHYPELINFLGKYRVYICEKKNNNSECYRLDEFSSSTARTDENLASKYLSGTFGGVPNL
ncbi:TPA: ATP-binding protein [Yersinia enterocolitica]|nr:ATP-binding protein [Yersinia enterocolitica]HEN3531713.1 ATP-binding protein [Yersinia enterocolitica]HEP1966001.1 ATP-binding protein [Yersinia enterocolitica]